MDDSTTRSHSFVEQFVRGAIRSWSNFNSFVEQFREQFVLDSSCHGEGTAS